MLFNIIRGGTMSFTEIIVYILSTLAVVFITLPIHEFAHGFAAVRLGDNTPRWQGRLTINPFAHIDYIGALCIVLFGFGWARPVQVNHNNFRNPKRDMALTALAGPLSNIIMSVAAMLLANTFTLVFSKSGIMALIYIAFFFQWIARINISLAVFNLIPIPPLDGSRLLSALLPDKYYYALMRYERYIYYGLLLLIIVGALDIPLSFLTNIVMNGVGFIAGLPFRFIG